MNDIARVSDGRNSEYVLLMSGDASFYISNQSPFPTCRFSTDVGPAEFSFTQVRTLLPGFTRPVRHGISVEIRGRAASMSDAVESWANMARGLMAILSTVANAAVSDLEMVSCVDVTPGKSRREYMSQSTTDTPINPIHGRILPFELARVVIAQWLNRKSSELARLHSGFSHYQIALQEWKPGLETSAVGRLWIVAEAIDEIVLDRYLLANNLDRETLASRWGVKPTALVPEARKRLIFHGDTDVYSNARDTRHGTQHAGQYFDWIRDRAVPARDKTAVYVRQALLDLLDLPKGVLDFLTTDSWNRPISGDARLRMHGHIVRPSNSKRREAGHYPRIDWAVRMVEAGFDDEGDAVMQPVPAIRSQLAGKERFVFDYFSLETSEASRVIENPFTRRRRLRRIPIAVFKGTPKARISHKLKHAQKP